MTKQGNLFGAPPPCALCKHEVHTGLCAFAGCRCDPSARDDDSEIKALGGDGILNRDDLPSLNKAMILIRDLMLDGRWHMDEEVIAVSGQREGLRRMRQLRDHGFVVSMRRSTPYKRRFEYMLSRKVGR